MILGIPREWALALVLLFLAFQVLRRPHRPPLRSWPSQELVADADGVMVTFLVAAWNASEKLQSFMEGFDSVTLPNKELVLCCGGPDNTYAESLAFEKPNVIILEQLPGQGKQGGLRAGFPYSKGDMIYLTDIDCVPNDTAVNLLIRRLQKSNLAAVSGAIQPLPHQHAIPIVRSQWAIERYLSLSTPELIEGLRGANAVVWRRVIEETGSFKQDAPSGTDYTLAKEIVRIHGVIGFESNSEMPTEYPQSIRQYISKQSRWLRNVLVLGKKYDARREVRGVYRTIGLAGFTMLCGLMALLWLPAIWIFGGLFVQTVINRYHYHRWSGVSVSVVGVFETIVGDWGAALKAAYQVLFHQLTW